MISNERRRELYRRKTPEQKKKMVERTKEWIHEHPKKRKEYQKRWKFKKGIDKVREENAFSQKKYRSSPWIKTYQGIKQRIKRAKKLDKWGNSYRCYVGILNFLMPSDLKMMWFRDNAEKMIKPSIDRKDSNGHYTLENCQYIEMKNNRAKARGRIKRQDICRNE